jgi:protein tyrosine phosphatase
MSEVKWVIAGKLARGRRPGYDGLRESVPEPVVADWCDSVASEGIRSILCLLAAEHLELYAEVTGGLLRYYETRDFKVAHVSVVDHKWPPLDHAELEAVWEAFRAMPGPVLIHCSAGIDRTGAAITHIRAKLNSEQATLA